MSLSIKLRESIRQRAQNDPAFRVGLLTEAAECLLRDEVDEAKVLLRDYVNATIGFEALGNITRKKPQSLMRMLSASGNPSLENIALVMSSLRKHEGVELQVRAS